MLLQVWPQIMGAIGADLQSLAPIISSEKQLNPAFIIILSNQNSA